MKIKCWLLAMLSVVVLDLYGQETDTLHDRNIYKPYRTESADSIHENLCRDRSRPVPTNDSIQAREQFINDSLMAREIFVKDSILAREIFVRDSLIRRQRIKDSVLFLRNELQGLMEAYSTANDERIILKFNPIAVLGDSVLGDFIYSSLPFGIRDPYSPWKTKLILSGKSMRIDKDSRNGLINSIHTSQFKATFERKSRDLLIIHHPAVIQKNNMGSFYKKPVDSVFYDAAGRIAKIKRSVIFHTLTSDNQRGPHLFTNAVQVKQYRYQNNGDYASFQLVRFCERWKAWETNKVCSIINYTFERNGNKVKLVRRNDPENPYSDGTYTFTFIDKGDLSGISFMNTANTEGWERTIELNKDGNVSCYFDKSNGLIIQSLCMIYHPEPGAKYPVEIITTIFEKDGISYLQNNNTTGKTRTRDRMTLEWSTWK